MPQPPNVNETVRATKGKKDEFSIQLEGLEFAKHSVLIAEISLIEVYFNDLLKEMLTVKKGDEDASSIVRKG